MTETMNITKRIASVMLAVLVAVTCLLANTDEAAAASVKPSKVTISAAKSAGYNSVKVTWKKTKNAKTYQVYRATSKSGKYKKVATTKSLFYTNKSLTTGKTYYYKVRGVNGKKTGSFSSVKSAKPSLKATSKVTVSSVKSTSAKVSWKKVTGASGYALYRAKNGGSHKLVKTTTALSYSDTKLTGQVNYSYKVVPYRTVSGKKVYGAYRLASPFTTPAGACAHAWKDHCVTKVVQEKRTRTVGGGVQCNFCSYQSENSVAVMDHVIVAHDGATGEVAHRLPDTTETYYVNVEKQVVDYTYCTKCGVKK